MPLGSIRKRYGCLVFTVALYLLVKNLYILSSIGRGTAHQNEYEFKLASRSEKTDTNLQIPFLRPEWFNHTYNANRKVTSVECRAILEGDPAEISRAKSFMTSRKKTVIPDSDFVKLAQNCTEFTENRSYIPTHLSEEEAKFPIAYSIIMYKDVAQAEKLLRAIYRPQNTYCIHVDKKSDGAVKAGMQAIANCFPNVFVANKSEWVVYASFSRLQADINCMTEALNFNPHWKYYINLASQAFPLKTNYEIVKILKIYNGANDIEGLANRVLKSRFLYKWETVYSSKKPPQIKNTKKLKGRPPHNLTIVRGSAYGIFSRGFTEFVVNDKIARDLLEWSRDTATPDEHYWATLHHLQKNPHLKTPGGYKGDATDKKPWLAAYASWYPRDSCYSKRWVRGVCIFGVGDLQQLIHRNELFANKFYIDYEPLTLECLEEWLYNKSVSPLPFDSYFYRQLPFIGK